MNALPAINARVVLSAEALGILSSSKNNRGRDATIAGTVREYATGRDATKAVVVWDRPRGSVEQLLPKYLELA